MTRAVLDGPGDALISSLTFKHLYPTFEKALVNLTGQLRPGAVVAIDLIEGFSKGEYDLVLVKREPERSSRGVRVWRESDVAFVEKLIVETPGYVTP